MSKFLSNKLRNLIPYVPGEQPKKGEFIKLNTNENPYPPSQNMADIAQKVAKELNLYCDPNCSVLTDTFCKYYNIDCNEVLFGNGSDEILAFCYLAFCDREVAFPNISYGFYQVFSDLFNIQAEQIALNDKFEINIEAYFNKNKTIIIANPNAPTGIALNENQIETILQNNAQNVVVIDEAYADFSGYSAKKLINKYENLVVVGTFSKSRNLAGARLGYAIANENLISDLAMVKNSYNPYNVNALTQTLGIESIRDDAYFKECIQKIINERNNFIEFLDRNDFYTLPSKANFVFTKSNTISGEQLYQNLREQKILVRYFKTIGDFVRITIGTTEEMNAVKKALKN
ncbi:histidinol-phosphate transaminase [Candidatus Epulonipiscioides gigas]|nr:histidinol-phosphate transaminase [Epulopiscium sp. SCG-C07WGA-EpuloA2]